MSHVPVSTIEMSTSMRKTRADQRSSITILVLGDGTSFVFFFGAFLLFVWIHNANTMDLPRLEATNDQSNLQCRGAAGTAQPGGARC